MIAPAKDRRRRTRWFLRGEPPARPGVYECGVRWTNAMRNLAMWNLEWDGKGFLVPFPMVVHQWRGLVKNHAILTPRTAHTRRTERHD